MLKSANDPALHTRLRIEAETLLKSGTAATVGHYSLSLDALNLLHRLSSDPRTAGDALKLLHELQVHQVELDLQNEEIQNAEQLLAEDLSHYKELYEKAPAAYLLVDFQGSIMKANQAFADLLGLEHNRLEGAPMTRFLAPESHAAFQAFLDKVRQDGFEEIANIIARDDKTTSGPLRMSASISLDKRFALLVCHEGA